jgi:monoamine oxidase
LSATRLQGNKIELGAEFIHGSASEAYNIGKALKLPMQELFCTAQGDGGPDEKPVKGGYSLYYQSEGSQLLRFDSEEAEFSRTNESLWEMLTMDASKIPEEQSMLDLFEQRDFTENMRRMATAGFSNTLCANSAELSLKQMVRWTQAWEHDEGEYCLEGSYAVIVDHLRRGVTVEVSTPVARVDYSTAYSDPATPSVDPAAPTAPATPAVAAPTPVAMVTTSSGQRYHTRCVVVTASAHVMQADLIDFCPPLPATVVDAYACLKMNPAMKILLCFTQCPWPTHVQGMICAGTGVPEFWFNEFVDGTDGQKRYVAVGYCAAEYVSRQMETECEVETKGETCVTEDRAAQEQGMVRRTMEQLGTMMALLKPEHMKAKAGEGSAADVAAMPSAESCFEKGQVYEWSPTTHPYVGGGYASPLAGHSVLYAQTLAAPLRDEGATEGSAGGAGRGALVLFAGEATALKAGATVEAAMESGLRAAAQVKRELGIKNKSKCSVS